VADVDLGGEAVVAALVRPVHRVLRVHVPDQLREGQHAGAAGHRAQEVFPVVLGRLAALLDIDPVVLGGAMLIHVVEAADHQLAAVGVLVAVALVALGTFTEIVPGRKNAILIGH
jgi:hypothetical protein